MFIYILSNQNEVSFSPATVSNVPLSPQSVQQRKKIESVDLHRQDEEKILTVEKSLTFIDFLFFPPCLRLSSRVAMRISTRPKRQEQRQSSFAPLTAN